MLRDRVQWEDIPNDIINKWLSAYKLDKWPFKDNDKHAANREKIAKIYSEIHQFEKVGEGDEDQGYSNPTKDHLPKDPNLKILYDILKNSKCAVFDDAKMKQNINSKETSGYKTCEIAVRRINRFIENL